MKVLYDHQAFTMQEYGGISRYMQELIKRFPTGDARVAISYSNNAYLEDNAGKPVRSFFPKYKSPKKNDLLQWINQRESIQQIRQGQFDILHPTYYDPYFLKYLNGKPFTATFHDMIHEKMWEKYPYLSGDQQIVKDKQTLLAHAKKVIAVSASTKKDMVGLLGVDASKIEVIHLASSIDASMENAPRIVPAPYLLFVGNRWLYKNFALLLQAVSPILQQHSGTGLQLVCAGGGAFSKHDLHLIAQQHLQDKVVYKPIDDKSLVNLYKHAEAFIFPSEYEGFGIPVLEAFSCGSPALLSNASSLPEVGGDAALYFDPADAASMHDTIANALGDSTLRQSLQQKGSARAALFSWDKTYQQTVEVYRSLL